jgi:hypothetical protein
VTSDLFSTTEKSAVYAGGLGCLAFIVWMIFTTGQTVGRNEAAREAREARECDCGEVKSCAFAPGIVGVRSCQRYDNRWGRCEPDPKYRTTDEAPSRDHPWTPGSAIRELMEKGNVP